MLQALRNELRRGLRSAYFYLGLTVCLLIYAMGQNINIWRSVFAGISEWIHCHNGFMMEFNPYRTLLPLAATLPYCASVAEDWEHRTHYAIQNRCSFASYCNAKFLAAAILGGIVLTIGLWVFLGVMACFIPPFDSSTYREPFIEPILQRGQWGLYFLYFGSLQFFLGALCAGVGCVTATLTPRRGMIYLCPLLLFAMLEIVTNITIVGLSAGQSSISMSVEPQTPLRVYAVIAGILLGLTAICYCAFRTLFRKRVFLWQ